MGVFTMAQYTLSFDFIGSFTTDQPLLSIWYGGVKLSASFAETTSKSLTLTIDTDTTTFRHSELRFHFAKTGSEAGRSVTVSNIQIDGAALNTTHFTGSNIETNGSTIILNRGESADYETAAEIPDVSDNLPPIHGTEGAENLYGTQHDDVINGYGGNDRLYGNNGGDTITGGDGADVVAGGHGDDFLYGQEGDDKVYGGFDNDRLEGGAGNDLLLGEAGDDTIYGGIGNDTVNAGTGDDIVYGEDGDDRIYGGGGSRDEIYGGGGNDKMYAGEGDDYLDGGDGNDVIAGYAGDDTILGNSGNDFIDGGDGNDTMYGGIGDDNVYGKNGNDVLRAGDGEDNVFGNSNNDNVYGDAGDDSVFGGNEDDNVYGGADNDFVGGEDGTDRVEGNDGDDYVSGGLGSDIVLGGSGNDSLYAGGIDTYDVTLMQIADNTLIHNYHAQSVYKIVIGPVDFATAQSGASAQTINGVAGSLLSIESLAENTFIQEQLVEAGVADTWLSATDSGTEGQWEWNSGALDGAVFWDSGAVQNNSFANISGGSSNASQDNLRMLDNGQWQDESGSLNVQAYVVEWNFEDLIADTATNQLFGGVGDDKLFGASGNDTLKGEDGNDLLAGGDGNDSISGQNGNDSLFGGAGNDILSGGVGSDVVHGDAGDDIMFYDAADTFDGGSGFDTVRLESYDNGVVDFSNMDNVERIALDNYQGRAGANTLTLSYSDIADISGGNELYISADLGLDIVTISDLDTSTQYVTTTKVDNVFYEQYTNGSSTFFLEVGLVTADQAFAIDPVTTDSLSNSVDINTGSYLAKTTGIAFQTGNDVNTLQMLYEQGGTTRGISIFIENGELNLAAWNYAEENWGYKEVTVGVAANTRYTASMVLDGAFPANGTIEGFLNGSSIGTVNGVGNLYAHSGAIGIGEVADNTVANDTGLTATSEFVGIVQKLSQYNAAYSGVQLDALHDTLANGWLGVDPGDNAAPDLVDDTATAYSGTGVQIDVLANDTDADGDVLGVTGVGVATNGVVVLNPDGTVTYTANNGYTGADSFTYTVTDGTETSTATVNVTVEAPPTLGSPADIAGVISWYDANDVSTHIDANSDLVLEGLDDKGSDNLDALQGTTSRQPDVVTIDGDQWLSFDGDDGLDIANSSLINTASSYDGKSIAMSFRTGSDINSRQVLYEQGGGTRGLNMFIEGGDIYISGWNFRETVWSANVSDSISTNTAYVASLVYDGVAGTFTGYLNGSSLGTINALDLLYTHSGDIGIGAMNNGGYYVTDSDGGDGNYFTGHIGELVLYDNAISSSDRAALDQYLVDKWVTPPANAAFEDTPVLAAAEPEVVQSVTLMGNMQNDTLYGEAGNDLISGGDGLDTLRGYEGDDEISGDGGDDVITGDGKSLDESLYTYGGNDTLYGGDGNDQVYGGRGDDALYGDDGLDQLYGGSGDDTLNGGAGNDKLWGDSGNNFVTSGNDILNGGAGRDDLYGQDGDDTLLFGEGHDYLYGQAGADTFAAYETTGQDNDMAYAFDFSEVQGDKIDISALLSGYDELTDNISDFVNVAQGANTTIQVDRDGAGTQFGWDNVLRLQGNTSLSTDESQLISDGTLII